MKALSKTYAIQGIDLFSQPNRTGQGRLTIGRNILLFPDGHIEKRTGYKEAADFEKFFIDKPVINIIKYLDYNVVFYSDGTVKTDFKERAISKVNTTAAIQTVRSSELHGWSFAISKDLDSVYGFGSIDDNENVFTPIPTTVYGDLKLEISNGAETVNIQAGDVLAIDTLDVYLPALSGEDILYPDSKGNTYYDEDLAEPAYIHDHYDLLNLILYDKVKFNNIYMLTDGTDLYKMHKTSADEVDYENRIYSVVGSEIVIRKRSDCSFIEKIGFTRVGELTVQYCVDDHERRIYIIQADDLNINLQVFDLVTLTLIHSDDYAVTHNVSALYCCAADQHHIWFLFQSEAYIASIIGRFSKSDFTMTEACFAVTYGAPPYKWTDRPEWGCFDIDYFGNALFIGFKTLCRIDEVDYCGYYILKDPIGVPVAPVGWLICPSSFQAVENIKIFNEYVLVTQDYLLSYLQAYKKNSEDDNYSWLAKGPAYNSLLDLVVYDEMDANGLKVAVCYCKYYFATYKFKAVFFEPEASLFDVTITLEENCTDAVLSSYKTSREQYYQEPSRLKIEKVNSPPQPCVSVIPLSSDGVLNGTYQYKYKYVLDEKESEWSAESAAIEITTGSKMLIERIIIPSGAEAEIFRKESAESSWLYIGKTAENFMIDDGVYSLNLGATNRIKIAPSMKCLEEFFGMLFGLGAGEYKNYAFWSQTDDAEVYPAENFRAFNEFKDLVALKKLGDNLYFFGDEGVTRLSGYSAETFYFNLFNRKIKKVIHKTIRQHNNILLLQSDNRVYKFDGFNFQDISGFVLGDELQYSESNHAVIYKDKYFLFANKTFVYDLILDQWIEYTNYAFLFAEEFDGALLMAKDNKIFELDTGYADDTAPVPLQIKTKQFDLDDPVSRKVFERINILAGGLTDKIDIYSTIGENEAELTSCYITENDGRDQSIISIRPKNGRGRSCQLEIKEETAGNIKINGIELKYRALLIRRNDNRFFGKFEAEEE